MRVGGLKIASHRMEVGIFFCLTLAVYYKTMAPGLTFIDSGELAAVATRLGIAHPTGYPLFTLLGWVATHLPFGPEPIVRLNFLAALLCAGSAALFYCVVLHLLSVVGRASKGSEEYPVLERAGALGATLLLGFSETFWSQALAIEVYSLHLFLLSAILLVFFRAILPGKNDVTTGERRWSVFAFLLGLSFANHMTTILLAPGMLFLYFAFQGRRKASWVRLGRMVPFLLLGLSPYFYLPIRAAQGPFFNWGAPATVERFLWHVSGKQYRVWMFSSTESAGRQFKYFLETLPSEVAYIGLAFALVGIIVVLKSNRRLFWGSLLMFAACVGYSINYDIHDIDSYFLLAYVTLVLWSSFGIVAAFRLFASRWSVPPLIWKFAGMCVAVPALVMNFGRVDQSGNRSVENYTNDVFASLAPNALVLSYQWDFWVSASLYVQYVRGYRADAAVVDKELLRRSWYLQELSVRYPWLVDRSKGEIEAFGKELYKFEHNLAYNPSVIQARFEEMIRSLIRNNIGTRPVYVTPEIEPEFTREWQRVPVGLAQRLYADSIFHPSELPVFKGQPGVSRERLEQTMHRLYADAFVQRAQYYYSMGGYSEDVNQALKSALLFDKNHQGAHRLLALVPR